MYLVHYIDKIVYVVYSFQVSGGQVYKSKHQIERLRIEFIFYADHSGMHNQHLFNAPPKINSVIYFYCILIIA